MTDQTGRDLYETLRRRLEALPGRSGIRAVLLLDDDDRPLLRAGLLPDGRTVRSVALCLRAGEAGRRMSPAARRGDAYMQTPRLCCHLRRLGRGLRLVSICGPAALPALLHRVLDPVAASIEAAIADHIADARGA